jgi:hypothetical protein
MRRSLRLTAAWAAHSVRVKSVPWRPLASPGSSSRFASSAQVDHLVANLGSVGKRTSRRKQLDALQSVAMAIEQVPGDRLPDVLRQLSSLSKSIASALEGEADTLGSLPPVRSPRDVESPLRLDDRLSSLQACVQQSFELFSWVVATTRLTPEGVMRGAGGRDAQEAVVATVRAFSKCLSAMVRGCAPDVARVPTTEHQEVCLSNLADTIPVALSGISSLSELATIGLPLSGGALPPPWARAPLQASLQDFQSVLPSILRTALMCTEAPVPKALASTAPQVAAALKPGSAALDLCRSTLAILEPGADHSAILSPVESLIRTSIPVLPPSSNAPLLASLVLSLSRLRAPSVAVRSGLLAHALGATDGTPSLLQSARLLQASLSTAASVPQSCDASLSEALIGRALHLQTRVKDPSSLAEDVLRATSMLWGALKRVQGNLPAPVVAQTSELFSSLAEQSCAVMRDAIEEDVAPSPEMLRAAAAAFIVAEEARLPPLEELSLRLLGTCDSSTTGLTQAFRELPPPTLISLVRRASSVDEPGVLTSTIIQAGCFALRPTIRNLDTAILCGASRALGWAQLSLHAQSGVASRAGLVKLVQYSLKPAFLSLDSVVASCHRELHRRFVSPVEAAVEAAKAQALTATGLAGAMPGASPKARQAIHVARTDVAKRLSLSVQETRELSFALAQLAAPLPWAPNLAPTTDAVTDAETARERLLARKAGEASGAASSTVEEAIAAATDQRALAAAVIDATAIAVRQSFSDHPDPEAAVAWLRACVRSWHVPSLSSLQAALRATSGAASLSAPQAARLLSALASLDPTSTGPTFAQAGQSALEAITRHLRAVVRRPARPAEMAEAANLASTALWAAAVLPVKDHHTLFDAAQSILWAGFGDATDADHLRQSGTEPAELTKMAVDMVSSQDRPSLSSLNEASLMRLRQASISAGLGLSPPVVLPRSLQWATDSPVATGLPRVKVSALQSQVVESLKSLPCQSFVVEHMTDQGLVLDAAWPALKIALEVEGPSHFAPDGYLESGGLPTAESAKALWKTRVLEAAGWRVVKVAYFEWTGAFSAPSPPMSVVPSTVTESVGGSDALVDDDLLENVGRLRVLPSDALVASPTEHMSAAQRIRLLRLRLPEEVFLSEAELQATRGRIDVDTGSNLPLEERVDASQAAIDSALGQSRSDEEVLFRRAQDDDFQRRSTEGATLDTRELMIKALSEDTPEEILRELSADDLTSLWESVKLLDPSLTLEGDVPSSQEGEAVWSPSDLPPPPQGVSHTTLSPEAYQDKVKQARSLVQRTGLGSAGSTEEKDGSLSFPAAPHDPSDPEGSALLRYELAGVDADTASGILSHLPRHPPASLGGLIDWSMVSIRSVGEASLRTALAAMRAADVRAFGRHALYGRGGGPGPESKALGPAPVTPSPPDSEGEDSQFGDFTDHIAALRHVGVQALAEQPRSEAPRGRAPLGPGGIQRRWSDVDIAQLSGVYPSLASDNTPERNRAIASLRAGYGATGTPVELFVEGTGASGAVGIVSWDGVEVLPPDEVAQTLAQAARRNARRASLLQGGGAVESDEEEAELKQEAKTALGMGMSARGRSDVSARTQAVRDRIAEGRQSLSKSRQDKLARSFGMPGADDDADEVADDATAGSQLAELAQQMRALDPEAEEEKHVRQSSAGADWMTKADQALGEALGGVDPSKMRPEDVAGFAKALEERGGREGLEGGSELHAALMEGLGGGDQSLEAVERVLKDTMSEAGMDEDTGAAAFGKMLQHPEMLEALMNRMQREGPESDLSPLKSDPSSGRGAFGALPRSPEEAEAMERVKQGKASSKEEQESHQLHEEFLARLARADQALRGGKPSAEEGVEMGLGDVIESMQAGGALDLDEDRAREALASLKEEDLVAVFGSREEAAKALEALEVGAGEVPEDMSSLMKEMEGLGKLMQGGGGSRR